LYNTILFDLDGTLTDPKVGITKSVQYALKKMGIPEDNLDALVKFIGPPLANSFQEYYALDSIRAQKAVEYYREYFAPFGIYENEIYPKIPALLERLSKDRKSLMVATSKPTIFAEKILDHFDIRRYFSVVAGSNLDGTQVVKGEVIQSILAGIENIQRDQVVMVGDRKHDIIGAKANRIDSIGVTYGFGSFEELQKEHPTLIAHDIEELFGLLMS
jgi:phosphoglycolate phosphatase